MKINNLQNLLGGGLKDKLGLKFKKIFTLGFFALAFFVFGLGFGKDVSATTYYMRADGTSLDKSTATSCSNNTTAMSISTHNSSTFAAGDIIYLCDDGGDYTSTLIPPTNGLLSNGILYEAASGDFPVFDMGSSVNFAISNQKNYLTFRDITVKNATTANLYISAGRGTVLENIKSIGGVIGILYYSNEMVTMSNCEASGSSSDGFRFTGGISGTITDCSSHNNGGSGFLWWNATASRIMDYNISNSNAYNNGGMGFRGWNTAGVSLNIESTSNVAQENFVDGFNIKDNVYLECNKCVAINNGSVSDSDSGDGYTAHDSSTLVVNKSIAYGNLKSGVAVTGASLGEIKNSTFYDNIENTFGSNWDGSDDIGIGISATGTWNIENNITQGHPVEMMISASAVLGGVDVSSNYNVFYDSLGGTAFDYNGVFYNFLNYRTASSSLDLNSKNENPLFINSSSNNFNLQYNSPAIDAGTSVGLTSDYAGNPIYGTPDIGAYEYQPPHVIGTDKIDIGAGARIYGDGKFRDKEATNSNLADLTITPESGNFNSYNADEVRPEWMDIKNITWDNVKEWTESSDVSGLTNTLHEVGDLEANKYYNVSVDDTLGLNIAGTNCTAGICKSDSNGKIAFTYTGTYSEHTFKVQAGDNSNPTLTNNTENKFNVETTSINLSLTTDENSTCRYSNNSMTTFNNATLFTTTGETNHTAELTNLTSGNYLYYAICRDSNNNESSYTLSFEIAPEEAKENISSPIIKTSEGKEKMKNSTIYSDEKEIKLQGEDIKLVSGSVKIYKNSKLIKTILADSNGKWNGKVKLSSDFSGYLKVKLYNQYGTFIADKKTKVKVDNEKPEFITFPSPRALVVKGNNISWEAKDNQKIDKYKIYLGGRIYKIKNNSFTVPTNTNPGLQYLRIRAYDKAGNSTYKETFILVR